LAQKINLKRTTEMVTLKLGSRGEEKGRAKRRKRITSLSNHEKEVRGEHQFESGEEVLAALAACPKKRLKQVRGGGVVREKIQNTKKRQKDTNGLFAAENAGKGGSGKALRRTLHKRRRRKKGESTIHL